MKHNIYVCCGERYVNNIKQGLCGGFGNVDDIIQWLFSHPKDDVFPEWNDKEIIKYIDKNYGKRFEEKKIEDYGWSIKEDLLREQK